MNTTTTTATQSTSVKTSAKAEKSTTRVLETRDMWANMFSQTADLVVAIALDKELAKDPRKPFGFLTSKESPNARDYVKALLHGFASPKANKFFAEIEDFKSLDRRVEIAVSAMQKIKLASDASKARTALDKADKKQAKALAAAIIELLSKAKEPTTKTTKTTKTTNTK